MALFKTKRHIQLGTDSETPRSQWSIPCCVSLSVYKRPAIQLPVDSDNEQDDNDPDYSQSDDEAPNIFSQNATQNLSRNPFARAAEPVEETRTEIHVIESFEQEQISGDEELADFSSRTSYAIESYESDSEESTKGFDMKDKNDTSVDKVPQIEDDVLKMLPLPQLSMEIPPAMIHKVASFEESKYGELPLMSTNLKNEKRVSRFSMSEEEYLAFKRSQEKVATSIPKKEDIPIVTQSYSTSQKTIPETVQESPQEASHTVSITDETTGVVKLIESGNQLQPELDPQSKELTEFVSKQPAQPIDSVSEQPKEKQREIKPNNEPVLDINKEETKDERRASLVSTAAQSILGDKLEDFTEKLAFIKKNIIMSIDSDEEEEEEEVENAEQMLKVIEEQRQKNRIPSHSESRATLHRRTSSLMDVAPSLARFMNHIGGAPEEPTPAPSVSNTFSPSSLFSAFTGPEPEVMKEEDEELFDFTKVLEIGKNVKTFSEGFVGNGLRMFNDVATRVKNSVEQDPKQRFQTAHRNESTSSTSSTNNENEWMHNYL